MHATITDDGVQKQDKTKFTVISWNACGMEVGAENDLADILQEQRCHWDAILLQEGPTRDTPGCTIVERGHALYCGANDQGKRTVGILLHQRWLEARLSFHVKDERMVYLDMDSGSFSIRMTSAHFPHALFHDDLYELELSRLQEVVNGGRMSKRMNLIGVDANAVLGRQTMTDDEHIIGMHGYGHRNERGHLLAAWLHGQRLAVAASQRQKSWDEVWTHELWSTQTRRQIDYVLYDEIRNDSLHDVGIAKELDGKSDHRATLASFFLSGRSAERQHRIKPRIGWKPKLCEAGKPTEYHKALDTALTACNRDIASMVVECATDTGIQQKKSQRKHDDDTQALFEARRREQKPDERKKLSKELWRALRRQRRRRAQDEIDSLTRQGVGINKLRRVQQRRAGVQRMTAVTNGAGELKTDPSDIAEVFALFYEDLYKEMEGRSLPEIDETSSHADSITREEVERALRKLKSGRTGADDGLVAEMVKTKHEGLTEVLVEFFDSILKNSIESPDSWRSTKMKVIFKKGDVQLPKNYRPISIIPVLAKLYSTILYQRLQPLLDARIADEQFGFRGGRGCSDAVHILRLVIEKSAEWGEELWIATLDAEKAFDRVHHSCLFQALIESGVDTSIIASLHRLYADMKATVVLWPGEESRTFDVQRGVRQGDPLSPILFNLVLNQTLEEVGAVWRRRGYGTNVGQDVRGDRLTHIAFADDVTLVARTWLSMKRMLIMIRDALSRRGLSLHPSKCKVQTNKGDCNIRGMTTIQDNFTVEVLEQDASLELLGTALNLLDVTREEVNNRMAAAWRLFWSLKSMLLNRNVSVRRRLHLFDTTVGSCATWCSESWTPRSDELRQLEVARRAMLRKIVACKRRAEESWVDWMVRATHAAVRVASQASVRDWRQYHWSRKWAWAGHVARSSADRWLYKITAWRDWEWQELCNSIGVDRQLRPSRRRWMRWEDSIRSFAKSLGWIGWMEQAHDRETWTSYGEDFCSRA